MATVIRIKRRADESPSENIVIKAKKPRKEDGEGASATSDEISTVLMRVGTVESKEEPLEPLVHKAIKKGWELRENYKKLGTSLSYKSKASEENKRRAVSKRYKIVSQSRGIGEPEQPSETENVADKENICCEGAEGLSSTPMELACFDAVLANDMEDVITCNGVALESEKYVYDIFYSNQPVNWEEVMEQAMCRIEREVLGNFDDSDSDQQYDDEDDENDEENWRNDYPDYDDSPCEDEEDYLNSQLRKGKTKQYGTDESYDEADYEEEGFDNEGNLIMSANPYSLIKLMKTTQVQDSSSDESAEF